MARVSREFLNRDMNFLNRDEAVAWGKKLIELLIHPPDVIPPQPKTTDVPSYSGEGQQMDKK